MRIYDNQFLLKSVTLTKDWKRFTFPSVERLQIYYDEENGHQQAVFLREATRFMVEFPERWNTWSCESPNENQRCGAVRRGHFAWGGKYVVSLKKGTN